MHFVIEASGTIVFFFCGITLGFETIIDKNGL